MSSSKMKRFVSIKGVIDNLRQSVNSPSPNSGNSNNSGGNSGNEGPASLEQDLIESLAPGQFTAELTLRHGFPNKPTGKSFFQPIFVIQFASEDFLLGSREIVILSKLQDFWLDYDY